MYGCTMYVCYIYDNEYMHVVTLFYLRFLRLVPSKYLSQLTPVLDLDPSRATPTVPRQTVNRRNHSNRNHNNRNNRPVNHPVLQIRLKTNKHFFKEGY